MGLVTEADFRQAVWRNHILKQSIGGKKGEEVYLSSTLQSPVSLWSKFIQGALSPLHFCISSFSPIGSCSGGKALLFGISADFGEE